ncbi:unnamed protein product [Rhizophagus irregularis]|nr:unnamed protein product [Rhizophagus irregularis]
MPQEKRQKTSKGKEKASYIKQTRASLTGAQKQEVCLKKLQKPTPKNKELAKEYDVSQEMISDILKESEKWLALKLDFYEASLKKQVKPNFPQVDEALGFWVEKAIDNNITISGELLAQKACDFATLLDVQDFKGSDGWVAGFKKRHNLESYVKHGEAASAPSEEDLNEMRKDLQNILKEYSPDDIFNIDKTGLYWKMEPNRTLSTGPAKAWELVQPVTITNGWRKTGILPPSTDDDIDFDFDEFEEVDQLQDLIGQLASKIYRSPISAEEYLEYEKDETNHQMMTDKEIIEMITEPEEPNVEGPEIPIISNYEALAALNQIITYMEQKSDKMEFSNDHIRTIKKLRKVIEWEEFHSKQQVTLDSCFRINKE